MGGYTVPAGNGGDRGGGFRPTGGFQLQQDAGASPIFDAQRAGANYTHGGNASVQTQQLPLGRFDDAQPQEPALEDLLLFEDLSDKIDDGDESDGGKDGGGGGGRGNAADEGMKEEKCKAHNTGML